jgi:hypothetical protein
MVTVRLRANGAVSVEITDQGAGIPVPEQARIFQRFYRSPAGNNQVPGTGLGLSIAHRIARAHGGDLTVMSRPGETTFRMTLPMYRKEAELSAGRILVVDDEPQIGIMRTTLTGAGYEVDDARTGEQSLEKIRLFHDLILMDINAGMGAWRLAGRFARIPVWRSSC